MRRAHWQIENGCHWQLDKTFREDTNQTRAGNAVKNLGTVRRIVLNLLNHDNSTVNLLPKNCRQALLNLSYRESIPLPCLIGPDSIRPIPFCLSAHTGDTNSALQQGPDSPLRPRLIRA